MGLTRDRNHLHSLLDSFDAGENGEPVQNGGRNPRWAVLCGVLVEKPSNSYMEFLATRRLMNLPEDPMTMCDLGDAGRVWVVARTGMSDQYSVWTLDALAASNRQLRAASDWYSAPASTGEEAEAKRSKDLTHRDAIDLYQLKRGRELAKRMTLDDYNFMDLELECPDTADSWRAAAQAVRCVWLDTEYSDWRDNEVSEILKEYGVPAGDFLDLSYMKQRPIYGPIRALTPMPMPPPPPRLLHLPLSMQLPHTMLSSPLSPPTTPPRTPTPPPSLDHLYSQPCKFPEGEELDSTLACKYVVFEPIRDIRAALPDVSTTFI